MNIRITAMIIVFLLIPLKIQAELKIHKNRVVHLGASVDTLMYIHALGKRNPPDHIYFFDKAPPYVVDFALGSTSKMILDWAKAIQNGQYEDYVQPEYVILGLTGEICTNYTEVKANILKSVDALKNLSHDVHILVSKYPSLPYAGGGMPDCQITYANQRTYKYQEVADHYNKWLETMFRDSKYYANIQIVDPWKNYNAIIEDSGVKIHPDRASTTIAGGIFLECLDSLRLNRDSNYYCE